MTFKYKECGIKFDEEKRLKIHCKTHQKDIYKKKQKRNKNPSKRDFERPNFDHSDAM